MQQRVQADRNWYPSISEIGGLGNVEIVCRNERVCSIECAERELCSGRLENEMDHWTDEERGVSERQCGVVERRWTRSAGYCEMRENSGELRIYQVWLDEIWYHEVQLGQFQIHEQVYRNSGQAWTGWRNRPHSEQQVLVLCILSIWNGRSL